LLDDEDTLNNMQDSLESIAQNQFMQNEELNTKAIETLEVMIKKEITIHTQSNAKLSLRKGKMKEAARLKGMDILDKVLKSTETKNIEQVKSVVSLYVSREISELADGGKKTITKTNYQVYVESIKSSGIASKSLDWSNQVKVEFPAKSILPATDTDLFAMKMVKWGEEVDKDKIPYYCHSMSSFYSLSIERASTNAEKEVKDLSSPIKLTFPVSDEEAKNPSKKKFKCAVLDGQDKLDTSGIAYVTNSLTVVSGVTYISFTSTHFSDFIVYWVSNDFQSIPTSVASVVEKQVDSLGNLTISQCIDMWI